MRCGTIIVYGLVLAAVSFGVVTETSAQESADRKGFSGKQLFEHKWMPIELPKLTPQQIRQAQLLRAGFAETNPSPQSLARRLRALDQDSVPFPGDGLGPLHNATSCAECHSGGGASDVDRNVTLITIDPRSEGLASPLSSGRDLLSLFPGLLSERGALSFNVVVHDKSTHDGYQKIRENLVNFVPGGVPDEWFVPEQRNSRAVAQRPVVAGRIGSFDYYLSQRSAPPLFGLGALESISLNRMRYVAKWQDKKTNGRITGRVAGKFGWRGQVQFLSQFVSSACAGELGLSQASSFQAGDPANPRYESLGQDMTADEVGKLTEYVAGLSRPVEKLDDRPTIRRGERVFNSIGCVTCHTADLRPVSGLFSDLLLHDMGEDLQAAFPAPVGELIDVKFINAVQFSVSGPKRGSGVYYGTSLGTALPQPYQFPQPEQPQFPRGDAAQINQSRAFELSWDALQREWRTPPLWGVADTAPYLHDGRAETLEEAILWHGGEAKWSRDDYAKLSRSDKDLVLKFLSSLRAPQPELAADK